MRFKFKIAVALAALSASPIYSAEDHLNLGVWVQERINDEPSFTYTTIKPALFYRVDSQKLSFNALIAVLYNRLETQVKIDDLPFRLDSGMETAWIIAGDSPRIDGQDFSDDEFKAHRISAFGGLEWDPHLKSIRTRMRLHYRIHYFNPYDFSNTPAITKPEAHIAHGPEAFVEIGDSRPPLEVIDHGSRIHHHSLYQWRNEDRPWGRANFQRRVDHYYAGSLGGSFRYSFKKDFEWLFKIQGSFISKADRLNAFSDGALSQETLGLTLGDHKADRASTSEFGLKIQILDASKCIVMPLIHGAVLREITPTHFRNIRGIGGGLKIMGAFNQKFLWDLTYANIFGTRNDLSGLHEAKLMLNYSLF